MKIASEKEQRTLSKELIPSDITTEVAPFSFKLKQGGEGVKPAAMGYIPHLSAKIFEILDQHSRYIMSLGTNKIAMMPDDISYSNGDLTWHNGVIPEDEIWIKLGGDKGGGRFLQNEFPDLQCELLQCQNQHLHLLHLPGL